ncbi:Hypothetical protein R9X50_00419300 [Acrodontium crateriforme]|uniref:AAA+ ATPase domain-containing protein n=1 Tax=Acrodontium crateriforme TaxID=150365 RepID=A0AAQ3RA04_9PEZI|nr:Hypothetical protein R9X50_00419300 [Acrodontium crateriforme]
MESTPPSVDESRGPTGKTSFSSLAANPKSFEANTSREQGSVDAADVADTDEWTEDNEDRDDDQSTDNDRHKKGDGADDEGDLADDEDEDKDGDASEGDGEKSDHEGPTGKVFDDPTNDYNLAYDVSRDLRNVGDGTFTRRAKDSYRRLVQSTSYAILMEERVKELEISIDEMRDRLESQTQVNGAAPSTNEIPRPSRRRDPYHIPDPPEPRREYYSRYRSRSRSRERMRIRELEYKPSIEDEKDESDGPEMILEGVLMTLDEFEGHIDVPKEKLNYFLEFLIEKPTSGRPAVAMHLSRSRRRRRKTMPKTGRGKVPEKDDPKRVERIRINSSILCEVLEDVLGKDVAPKTGDVVLRPFKPFLGYIKELRDHVEKLKADVAGEDKGEESNAEKLKTTNSENVENRRDEPAEKVAATHDEGQDNRDDETAESNAQGKEIGEAKPSTEVEGSVTDAPSHAAKSGERKLEHDGSSLDAKPNDANELDIVKPNSVPSTEEKSKTPAAKRLVHLQALLRCMDTDLKEIMDLHSQCRRRVKASVAFDDLWHMFQPGDIIWSPKENQAYQMLSVHDGRQILNPSMEASDDSRRGRDNNDLLAPVDEVSKNPFIIDAYHLDFDGDIFGPVQFHWTIKPWPNEKHIHKMDVYPLEFAQPKEIQVGSLVNTQSMLEAGLKMKQMLLERGKKFKMYANAEKVEAVDYKGLTMADLPEQIDSQVIIDTSYYYDTNKKEIPEIGLLDPTEGDRREVMDRCVCGRENCELKNCYDDRKVEQDRMDTFITENASSLLTTAEKAQDFKDDYLILLPGQLWGFVLHNRAWHPLDVSKIEPARKTQAFEDLVLKQEHRRLVESQVTMHSTGVKPAVGSVGSAELPDDKREDLVRGKGKGLIILLHGAPGVGKTSTAECVAEYTKRPLLSITCGDIGDEAIDVQRNLEYNLNLAHRWGCVMLLDEADVFLAARDKRDMKRNAVVSVFLRVLEYYSGILFLTTNKIGVIDEAFQSRIHLSLYYPPLDEEQTSRIWEINLRRQKKNKPHLEFEEKDLLRWAQFHWDRCKRTKSAPWNGRQIRNACQTVAALAEFDNGGKITVDHLKAVAKASAEFDNYLKSVHGGDNAFRAKRVQDRRDDYDNIRSGRDEEDDDYYRSGYAYVDDDDFDSGYRDAPPSSARLPRRGTAGSRRSVVRNEHYSPLYDDEYDIPRASRAEIGSDRDRRPPPPPEYDEPTTRERPVSTTMGPPPRPIRERQNAPRERWGEPERRPSRVRGSRDRGSDPDRRR